MRDMHDQKTASAPDAFLHKIGTGIRRMHCVPGQLLRAIIPLLSIPVGLCRNPQVALPIAASILISSSEMSSNEA